MTLARYKAHLAIDLDDVILDFVGNLADVVYREYGIRLVPERDISDWDLRKVLDPIVGENWWNWWRERDWLWAQAPTVPGAIGGLRTLRRKGYYLEVVTSKPEWAEAQTFRWLGKWRPPVHRVTIIGKDERKVDMTQAQLLVDDKPENVWEFLEAGRYGILFDRPHNVSATSLDHLRAVGWPATVAMIERLFETYGDEDE